MGGGSELRERISRTENQGGGLPSPEASDTVSLTDSRGEPECSQPAGHRSLSRSNSLKERAGELWEKVRTRCQLRDFHSLPHYLRDNEFILRHYRADWPLRETFMSLWSIHNETGNIWTHMLGFLLFLGLTIYTAAKIPKVVRLPTLEGLLQLPFHTPMVPFLSSLQLKVGESLALGSGSGGAAPQPIARWPFLLFLAGAMLCLLFSSLCHLFSCHSARLSHVLWRFDYAGIAALIATSFFPSVYYSFLCDAPARNTYLVAISLLGLAAVAASLLPLFQTPAYRAFRAALFFGMGFSGVIPCVHKVVAYPHEPTVLLTALYEAIMGAFYGLGALFYATRVPERWLPGKFDIAGHSHQIFHVLVILGALTHYFSGLVYLQWRDLRGCSVP